MQYPVFRPSSGSGLHFAALLLDGFTTLVNDLWPLKSEVSPQGRSTAQPAVRGTSSRRPASDTEPVKPMRLVVAGPIVALCLVAAIDATSYGVPYQVALSRSSQSSAHSVPTCKAAQLDVGGVGSSAAAGTGIVTIRITDVSATSCALDGWPMPIFLSRSHQALAVTVTHNGPGSFFGFAGTVVLRPRVDPTVGFVVTSADFPAANESCQNVSSIRVILPEVSGSFYGPALQNLTHYRLCDSGDPVNISSIARVGAVDGYAPVYPRCLSLQLRLSLGPEGAASGSAIESGFLTNKSTVECTLQGYPSLSLLDAAGRTLVRFGPGTATYTLFDPARPRPVTLEPGIAAKFEFSASDYNPTANKGGGAPCPISHELRIALPSRGGSIVSHRTFQLCGLAGVGAITEAT